MIPRKCSPSKVLRLCHILFVYIIKYQWLTLLMKSLVMQMTHIKFVMSIICFTQLTIAMNCIRQSLLLLLYTNYKKLLHKNAILPGLKYMYTDNSKLPNKTVTKFQVMNHLCTNYNEEVSCNQSSCYIEFRVVSYWPFSQQNW